MRTVLTACLLALTFVGPAHAADSIRTIKTLADLRKTPEVVVVPGVFMRVGMVDQVADMGPSRVLFGLMRVDGPGHRFESFSHECRLGPLDVEVTSNDVRQKLSKMSVQRSNDPGLPVGESLFCQLIPLAADRAQTIRIYADDPAKPLLSVDIPPQPKSPCYWSEFLSRRSTRKGEYAVTATPPLAGPKYSAQTPIYVGQTGSTRPTDAITDSPLPSLPGLCDAAAPWQAAINQKPLKISIDGDDMVIDPLGAELILPPTKHLLARWWVNDSPVEMTREVNRLPSKARSRWGCRRRIRSECGSHCPST